MVMTGAELLRKAAGPIATSDFIAASGLLSAEQSTAFLDQVYEATPLSALIRKERRRSKSGTIAKIGIGGRQLRRKTAGVDDSTLVKPTFSDVAYQTAASRLDWEVEEEVLEENIEGEGLEEHLVRLMTTVIGIDLEDLHLNADTTVVVDADHTADDVAFLTQNDGWLRQIATGAIAHRIDGATINAGSISKDHFFAAVQATPSKYLNPAVMKWIANEVVLSRYAEYLSNRGTGAGDAVLASGQVTQIAGFGVVAASKMPNDRILLADPRNLIAVNTREIRRRKTTEGREAIRQDKRFYAIFLDDDPVIEEQDAIADIYGLAA